MMVMQYMLMWAHVVPYNIRTTPAFSPIISLCPSPQIALLKLLLAAAPTSKAKTDSINILADVLPEEMPYVWTPIRGND